MGLYSESRQAGGWMRLLFPSEGSLEEGFLRGNQGYEIAQEMEGSDCCKHPMLLGTDMMVEWKHRSNQLLLVTTTMVECNRHANLLLLGTTMTAAITPRSRQKSETYQGLEPTRAKVTRGPHPPQARAAQPCVMFRGAPTEARLRGHEK